MNFPGKKRLCQFLNIPIIYHNAGNQKQLMTHFREKCRTDRRTGNIDFIGTSLGQVQ